MKRIVGVGLLVIALGACGKPSDEAGDTRVDPVKIVRTSQATEVVVTSAAARRLDIHRASVRSEGTGTVVPYAAVLYTADGKTWVFAVAGRYRFVRTAVVVSDIRGDSVLLSKGPPAGTTVVTRGAAELLGAESGVGEQ